MRQRIRSVWKRARDLWERAKRERSTPRKIGLSVGVGVLSCLLPVLWFHLALALVLATILRLNRVWAAAASQIPSLFGLLRFPIIVPAEIELGHKLRTGDWLVGLNVREVPAEAVRLVVDLWTGALVIAPAAGLLCGSLAYLYASRRLSSRKPDESRPPSSESPPSAPPAPSP